jgi:glutathionylspermidine synthase
MNARARPSELRDNRPLVLLGADWIANPDAFRTEWTGYLHDAALSALIYDNTVAGEPYLALNALEIEPSALRRLIAATEILGRAFARAARAVQRDREALEDLGFPWAVAEILQQEPVLPVISPVGRFDFLLDQDGEWRVLEYNSDTPSGVRETIGAERLIWQRRLRGSGYRRLGRSLASRLRRSFARLLAEAPRNVRRLGLVTDAGYAEDLAQLVFLRELLAGVVPEIVLGDIENLSIRRGRVYVLDRQVQALYRLYPVERLYGQPQFPGLMEAAVAGRVLLLNPVAALLAQDKALMAWMWARRHAELFPPEEQAALVRHLPETYLIGDLTEGFDRREFVLKEFFGREGEEIYFGDVVSDEDWERARGWRTFVVQRLVTSQVVEDVVLDEQGWALVPKVPCVGSFLVDGRAAGLYVRLGERVTTNRARHVAAVVQRAATSQKGVTGVN